MDLWSGFALGTTSAPTLLPSYSFPAQVLPRSHRNMLCIAYVLYIVRLLYVICVLHMAYVLYSYILVFQIHLHTVIAIGTNRFCLESPRFGLFYEGSSLSLSSGTHQPPACRRVCCFSKVNSPISTLAPTQNVLAYGLHVMQPIMQCSRDYSPINSM